MERIDLPAVVRLLEARLGLRLSAGRQLIDGTYFDTVRPFDLEEGNGFCVALARSPRQVFASLHLDRYAGWLLRQMSAADDSSQASLRALIRAAEASGLQVYAELNGKPPSAAFADAEVWRGFEIDVSKRLTGKIGVAALSHSLVDCAAICMGLAMALMTVEELDDDLVVVGLPEGAVKRVEVNRYERSPANRAACIAYHGARCKGCGFSFSDVYGELADGYIEVHHVVPVSQLGAGYLIDPIVDLLPLCSNCHSVVHRRNPPLLLKELHALLARHSQAG